VHVFLTGEIQTGKSTVIRRYLEKHGDLRLGGFRTVWNARGAEKDSVHIVPAAYDVTLCDENRILSRCRTGERYEVRVFLETFEREGVRLLRESAGCGLYIMDEVGVREDGAPTFASEILDVLASSAPILGVVRAKPGMLTDAVRTHPGTTLITVTAENRESVLAELLNTDLTVPEGLWNAGVSRI